MLQQLPSVIGRIEVLIDPLFDVRGVLYVPGPALLLRSAIFHAVSLGGGVSAGSRKDIPALVHVCRHVLESQSRQEGVRRLLGIR